MTARQRPCYQDATMTESELVDRVALRAAMPRSAARLALEALADIAREEANAGHPIDIEAIVRGHAPAPVKAGNPSEVAAAEVEWLVEAARRHPLGLDFLLGGDPGAVAIMFNTHVFHVEAARRILGHVAL